MSIRARPKNVPETTNIASSRLDAVLAIGCGNYAPSLGAGEDPVNEIMASFMKRASKDDTKTETRSKQLMQSFKANKNLNARKWDDIKNGKVNDPLYVIGSTDLNMFCKLSITKQMIMATVYMEPSDKYLNKVNIINNFGGPHTVYSVTFNGLLGVIERLVDEAVTQYKSENGRHATLN
jgi:hypothetical protein